MRYRYLSALSFAAVALFPTQKAYAIHNAPSDIAALRKVAEDYRVAIIKKDQPAFANLFYSQDPSQVIWQFVVDDELVRRNKATKPDSIKARRLPQWTYASFIDYVAKSKDTAEDVFSDLQIDTDGDVASINYDYQYLVNKKETNHGREMWHLVRTEAGWKIISVIWSIRDPVPKESN